jgi:hypothetical protein
MDPEILADRLQASTPRECTEVVADVVNTRTVNGGTARILPDISISSPVSTERGIKYHLEFAEVIVEITGSVLEEGIQFSPLAGVWFACGDVCWDTSSGEEPDFAVLRGVFYGENTTTILVNGSPKDCMLLGSAV